MAFLIAWGAGRGARCAGPVGGVCVLGGAGPASGTKAFGGVTGLALVAGDRGLCRADSDQHISPGRTGVSRRAEGGGGWLPSGTSKSQFVTHPNALASGK